MPALLDLWLPILLSAVFVFIASSVIHMVLPIHRGDYRKMADEAAVLAAMREHGVTPGEYMFPCASSMKEMATPEHQEKMRQGPVGFLVVRSSNSIDMGRALGQWFVFCLVIGLLVAYVGKICLPRGVEGMTVFRVTAAIATVGHAFSNVTHSIWKGGSWKTTWKFVFDGVVYALVTGATFAWLWPAA